MAWDGVGPMRSRDLNVSPGGSFLVSHDVNHNERNRDGADANFSLNCGVEGPTD